MKRFEVPVAPACPDNVILWGDLRVTVITDRLFRVEKGAKTDLPTQKIWYRDLGRVAYSHKEQGGKLVVKTARVELTLSRNGALGSVLLDGKPLSTKGNLKGTARTLDQTDGAIPLGKGLIAMGGMTILEDNSLLLKDGGFVQREKGLDYYVFAYGHDFRTCLSDFYRVAGEVPLIPRYALGNWWSRYKAYSQDEYMAVMDGFEARKVPLTIATVDMDWHWTDVIKRFGKEAKPVPTDNFADKFLVAVAGFMFNGWTGYSWNTELFPDHKAFLDELHDRGYHVTLNVHPSHGVRFFEDHYADYCKVVGIDPATKQYVPFLLGKREYVEGYFDAIHHPLEDEGVDFWWLDWQQGTNSDVPGLDPLWAVNHYHYLDSGRGDKRPLILSRFAEAGSHRYPLGFSGDSSMDWPTLKFQPYFTANAANVGYTWWSHDIGGHHRRRKDDELYLRWVQFGVFSPINRLHSSVNEFMGKEPWKCAPHIERFVNEFMRLRQAMIPYIYSEAYRNHKDGIALCEPMYYGNPDAKEAYQVPDEYRFGSQLIVAPVTDPVHPKSGLAPVKVWLPEGTYTDFFTGRVYQGGSHLVYRAWDTIPVFAKEGAIVPTYTDREHNDLSCAQPHTLLLWAGDGQYDWYEDDGETNAFREGHFALTRIVQKREGDTLTLTIAPVQGDASVLPSSRTLTLAWQDVKSAKVVVDGQEQAYSKDLTLDYDPSKGLKVVLTDVVKPAKPSLRDEVINVISRYQQGNKYKYVRYTLFSKHPTKKLHGPKWMVGPIDELREICDAGPEENAKK